MEGSSAHWLHLTTAETAMWVRVRLKAAKIGLGRRCLQLHEFVHELVLLMACTNAQTGVATRKMSAAFMPLPVQMMPVHLLILVLPSCPKLVSSGIE